MSIFFCRQTGVRIVRPGVSESVDPVAGVPEWTGDEDGAEPGDAEDKKPKHGNQGGQGKNKQNQGNQNKGGKPATVPPPAPDSTVNDVVPPVVPVVNDNAPPFGSVQS